MAIHLFECSAKAVIIHIPDEQRRSTLHIKRRSLKNYTSKAQFQHANEVESVERTFIIVIKAIEFYKENKL